MFEDKKNVSDISENNIEHQDKTPERKKKNSKIAVSLKYCKTIVQKKNYKRLMIMDEPDEEVNVGEENKPLLPDKALLTERESNRKGNEIKRFLSVKNVIPISFRGGTRDRMWNERKMLGDDPLNDSSDLSQEKIEPVPSDDQLVSHVILVRKENAKQSNDNQGGGWGSNSNIKLNKSLFAQSQILPNEKNNIINTNTNNKNKTRNADKKNSIHVSKTNNNEQEKTKNNKIININLNKNKTNNNYNKKSNLNKTEINKDKKKRVIIGNRIDHNYDEFEKKKKINLKQIIIDRNENQNNKALNPKNKKIYNTKESDAGSNINPNINSSSGFVGSDTCDNLNLKNEKIEKNNISFDSEENETNRNKERKKSKKQNNALVIPNNEGNKNSNTINDKDILLKSHKIFKIKNFTSKSSNKYQKTEPNNNSRSLIKQNKDNNNINIKNYNNNVFHKEKRIPIINKHPEKIYMMTLPNSKPKSKNKLIVDKKSQDNKNIKYKNNNSNKNSINSHKSNNLLQTEKLKKSLKLKINQSSLDNKSKNKKNNIENNNKLNTNYLNFNSNIVFVGEKEEDEEKEIKFGSVNKRDSISKININSQTSNSNSIATNNCSLSNSTEKSKNKEKSHLLMLLNNPNNPYGSMFHDTSLKTRFGVEFHYNNFQHGVPLLRLKQLNQKIVVLPPLFKVKNSKIFKNQSPKSNGKINNFFKQRESSHKSQNKINIKINKEKQK